MFFVYHVFVYDCVIFLIQNDIVNVALVCRENETIRICFMRNFDGRAKLLERFMIFGIAQVRQITNAHATATRQGIWKGW